MKLFQKFIKLMKSEPKKKSNEWVITEDKVLLADEVDKLRKSCKQMKICGVREKKFFLVRNWFVIELGLFTGLRVEEMAQLEIRDILIDHSHSSVIVRHGKGNKKRAVWINAEFKRTCKSFLRTREKFGLVNDDENFLLTSQKGKSLTKRALQRQFKICLKNAFIPEHYSIHNLRHTYCTFLLRSSGNNYRLAQVQLGHSSIKTTQAYAGLIKEDTNIALEGLYK